MFCKHCGKDIGDAKFCQYCGNSNEGHSNATVNLIQNDLFANIKNKAKKIGHEKIINLTSAVATVINIIIRIVNNEISVVYNFLAQDDYFVLSKTGRNYMIIIIALQIVVSLFLYRNAKKEQISISKKTVVFLAVSLIIQVLAMMLRLPAPY